MIETTTGNQSGQKLSRIKSAQHLRRFLNKMRAIGRGRVPRLFATGRWLRRMNGVSGAG